MVIIHLKIHNLNTFSTELSDQTIEYLDLCIKTIEGKEQTLISYQTVTVLLYNCLKIMLGFNELDSTLVEKLKVLYRLFKMENVDRSYSWHILQMFFLIKIVIFWKKEEVEENDGI